MEQVNTSMTKQPPKKENLLLNILLNIAIPTFVLMKLSGDKYLGSQLGLVVALAFPVTYGIYDYFRAEKVNIFSVIGFISILLTGGFSLLKLDPQYIVIKEAAIPTIFGVMTIISLKTRYPLVKTIVYNSSVMDIDLISRRLKEKGNEKAFDSALVKSTLLLSSSFFLSAVLNYILAKMILVGQPGTEAFNAQLGKLTGISFVAIGIPSTLVLMGAIIYLFWKITHLTELSLEDVLLEHQEAKG